MPEETDEGYAVPCSRCGFGVLVKHCPPTNRCAWWVCDLPCGYRVDISTGIDAVIRRSTPSPTPGIDSDGGNDQDTEAPSGPYPQAATREEDRED